jgi:hypothetical protein
MQDGMHSSPSSLSCSAKRNERGKCLSGAEAQPYQCIDALENLGFFHLDEVPVETLRRNVRTKDTTELDTTRRHSPLNPLAARDHIAEHAQLLKVLPHVGHNLERVAVREALDPRVVRWRGLADLANAL